MKMTKVSRTHAITHFTVNPRKPVNVKKKTTTYSFEWVRRNAHGRLAAKYCIYLNGRWALNERSTRGVRTWVCVCDCLCIMRWDIYIDIAENQHIVPNYLVVCIVF